MEALLNLTLPPILFLVLPAAVVGNYTLPAPPLSEVAAVTPNGEPLPTWVLADRLYVLQGGSPAVAIYVPQYANASGFYTVAINTERAIVQAPPGVVIERIEPTPKGVEINKTGLYLYLEGPFMVTYTTIKPTQPPPSPTTPTTPTPSPIHTTPTIPSGTPTVSTPHTEVLGILAAALAVVLTIVVLLLRKRRGDCSHLNEVDLTILKTVESAGGAIDRSVLQTAINIPKTTLHRHLHKLAKYGFVRLVQEGPRQRVELLRRC
ncbi:MAG: helix-turn-helix transcriptional regulator [Pyrobaculum sp.]